MTSVRGASEIGRWELWSRGLLPTVLLAAVASFACSGGRVRADGPPAAPCLLESSTSQATPKEGSDSGQPAPAPHHGHHHHPQTSGEGARVSVETDAGGAKAAVVDHQKLTPYEHRGNELVGIATPSLGAKEHEVWRSRVAVGSSTPLHTHGSEEIFVFLKGRGWARIGDESVEFVAPATVIAPAGLPHQFFNTGDEPTEAIVIVRPGSEITDAEGAPLDLPWRR